MQAIEFGCQGFFPNGTHPVASLFVEMNPNLIDFNIHPAKREVKFKDSSTLHHGISSTVRAFFKQYTLNEIVEIEKTMPLLPEGIKEETEKIFRNNSLSSLRSHNSMHSIKDVGTNRLYPKTSYTQRSSDISRLVKSVAADEEG